MGQLLSSPAHYPARRPLSAGRRRLALALVDALGELLDDLGVEGVEVVGFAAADQPLVDVDLLVDPLGAGVAQVGLQARP